VGVTSDGKLDVPPNYVDAGWYKYGVRPGEKGTAVLDGHVDYGGVNPAPGVFKYLSNLKPGDEIKIMNEHGTYLRFTVTESDVYARTTFPADHVFGNDGRALVRIITCHGKWNPKIKTYDDRLVVTAVLSENQ
jgi:sortase (surface protein transpeptidase)